MAVVVHIMMAQEAEVVQPSQAPSDLLLPANPHPLKFPRPSKSCPTLGAKHLKHKPEKDIEDLNHNNAEGPSLINEYLHITKILLVTRT